MEGSEVNYIHLSVPSQVLGLSILVNSVHTLLG